MNNIVNPRNGKTCLVWGNYKKVYEDGAVVLKVVSFPVPENPRVVGESMWVRVIEGNDNEGIGSLCNEPFLCEEVNFGDIVKYKGGTNEKRPHYAGKCEEDDEE